MSLTQHCEFIFEYPCTNAGTLILFLVCFVSRLQASEVAAEIKRKLDKKEKKKKKRQKKLEALSTAEGDEEANGDVEVH